MRHRITCVALLAAISLAGCSSATSGRGTAQQTTSPAPTTSPTAAVTIGRQHLTVRVPAQLHLGPVTHSVVPLPCKVDGFTVQDGSGHALAQVLLAPTSCQQRKRPTINGYYGMYAARDDVAALPGVRNSTVPAGQLATFTETYTECTNSCSKHSLDVAVVFLSHPADPDLPAINVIELPDAASDFSPADFASHIQPG
jgi:hypothetical protein